jgi:hypothetical protein
VSCPEPSGRGPQRSAGACPDDSGVALVEFAIVLPLFALMLFAMIQFGLVFAGWSQLRSQVQSDTRLLSVDPPCGTITSCQNWIAGDIGNIVGTTGEANVSICYECAMSMTGVPFVVVCATVDVGDITGFLGPIRLSSRSEFYVEQPVPSLTDGTPPDCRPSG